MVLSTEWNNLRDANPSSCGIVAERILKLEDEKSDDEMRDRHHGAASAKKGLTT
jgi:hypothetical protein